ncbi:putative inorganic polyphosphate/ATP-NAD kinase [archaeon]|nr:putative inorganic polyphosphate/ATP-NAD kinase [archaeon]
MEKAALSVKKTPEAIKAALEIKEFLEARGVEVIFDHDSATELGLKGKKIGEFDADLLLVLGGDGMILKAASKTNMDIPVLGINFGTMGFLTEIKADKWIEGLERVLSDNYTLEERNKIDVFIEEEKVGEALNEAVVVTSSPVKMLHVKIFINSSEIDEVRADGIIVATPTGSTAYSMSAGGPILDPKTRAFVITPISPFQSSARSFVVPDSLEIRIKLVMSKKEAVLIVDGQQVAEILPDDEIVFRLSNRKISFIKLNGDFYRKIRERL